MKRIITLVLFLLISIYAKAQTDGISYQAVIIGPDVLELPGVDSEGNYLPTTEVTMKFTILEPGTNSNPNAGEIIFTEEQTTVTDEFGRINLIIGQGNFDEFEVIDWNGEPKSLKVEIDFKNGDGFVLMSTEKLTYVPYVAHRDITASGTLRVDDNTLLRGELTVESLATNLGGTLNVNGGNNTFLSGRVEVDSLASFNADLEVNNKSATNLSGALTVGEFNGEPDADAPTLLNGTLEVKGKSTFGALESMTLKVTDSTTLEGVVKIDTDKQTIIESTVHDDDINYTNTNNQTDQVDGDDPGKDKANYPLLVRGSTQGIAIEVIGKRRNGNNFVSFWDEEDQWGRIEGEVESEYRNNADYVFDQNSLGYDIADATMDLLFQAWDTAVAIGENIAAATAVAPCIGPIPCVMGPPPSWIVSTKAKLVAESIKTAAAVVNEGFAIAHKVSYDNNKDEFKGVTYASGAGDYAEYLLREHVDEKMTYGDIVGVKGGKISKELFGAERIMVVSYKPIVLGNMPQRKEEANFEKVAFMGQVPVKVFGKVNIGDYIIPSGKNDGIGIAISPSEIKVSQLKDIVGTAWGENLVGFKLVNVAVGLNRNDSSLILENLESKINKQAKEISNLKGKIEDILTRISNVEQGGSVSAKEALIKTKSGQINYQAYSSRKLAVVKSPETNIIYFEINEQDLEEGLALAKKMMLDSGNFDRNRKIFDKLENDTAFRQQFISNLQKKIDKQMKYHKEIDKSGY